jgi:hypothetical protein
MPTPVSRCVECRQPARGARRCPDCRQLVHQRCQGGHACLPRRARLAALTATMQARLVAYRVAMFRHTPCCAARVLAGRHIEEIPGAQPQNEE